MKWKKDKKEKEITTGKLRFNVGTMGSEVRIELLFDDGGDKTTLKLRPDTASHLAKRLIAAVQSIHELGEDR